LARKILLADDSVTAQNMGRKILADAGYEVVTVNNGSAALKKIAETKPDLIVLDVYMPGYSGLEVCQRIKEVQETSRIPVLLTVGKLEPFKPEEAKRVRAEGYIVKPFEASELLSALAKLEDKIVPRSEASKPGRFARANAALDEGRYDKTVAIDEDSGWKNRISFPHKKKEKAAEEDDEAVTYNPVNKDLRTVVEDKPAPKAHEEKREAKVEDERVNLAALAPEGLPKDVTPEEIAALAAAAAQVKGKTGDGATAEPAAASTAAHEELHTEAKHEEAKTEAQPAAELPKDAPVADAVTFASQKGEEKIEASKSNEEVAETSLPAPRPTDMVSVIASLEPLAPATLESASGNGAASHTAAEEPVTMAVAAGAGSSGTSSRWTAVSVALAADEAALSLEHEMQKAYAAFAAAETAHTVFIAPAPKVEPVAERMSESSSPVEAAVAEAIVSATEVPAPEVSQAMTAVASAATEAVSAAVKELEAVADSYSGVHPQVSSEQQPAPVEPFEPVTASTSEASQIVEAESPVVEAQMPESAAKFDGPETFEEAKHDEHRPMVEESKPVEPEPAPVASSQSSDSQISSDHAEPAVPAKAVESTEVTGKKDTDIAATTAAAWANWRRVRESGTPKTSESAPQDAAAMAVAAGAESSPEDPAADSDPSAIANIVDSVLADLRPKIFEEITRKMGKKK
jgi:CheY-like chemotaxis protein